MTKGEAGKVTPFRRRNPCPECGKLSSHEFYPFCSLRCKEVDLNRWLSGRYVIPGPADEDADAGTSRDADGA